MRNQRSRIPALDHPLTRAVLTCLQPSTCKAGANPVTPPQRLYTSVRSPADLLVVEQLESYSFNCVFWKNRIGLYWKFLNSSS